MSRRPRANTLNRIKRAEKLSKAGHSYTLARRINTHNPKSEDAIHDALLLHHTVDDLSIQPNELLLPVWNQAHYKLLQTAFVVAASRVSKQNTKERFQFINNNTMLLLAELNRDPYYFSKYESYDASVRFREMWVLLPRLSSGTRRVMRTSVNLAYAGHKVPQGHRESFHTVIHLYLGMVLGHARIPQLIDEKSGKVV